MRLAPEHHRLIGIVELPYFTIEEAELLIHGLNRIVPSALLRKVGTIESDRLPALVQSVGTAIAEAIQSAERTAAWPQ
jgi:hypothetical protein